MRLIKDEPTQAVWPSCMHMRRHKMNTNPHPDPAFISEIRDPAQIAGNSTLPMTVTVLEDYQST